MHSFTYIKPDRGTFLIMDHVYKLIKYGLNSARTGKVNKTRPTSYTVMDLEILHILKIKTSTICNKKERHIEN